MKKLTMKLTTGFVLLLTLSFLLQSFSRTPKKLIESKLITYQVTSSAGCTYNFRGYVGYTLNPVNVVGFEGAVTPSGNCGVTGAIEVHADITTDANEQIVDIVWTAANPQLLPGLSDPDVEGPFADYLEKIVR